jgi:uncharacterized protein YyaL (SSP411 family)
MHGGDAMGRNRLGDTASPYLRQHADNPVHWWPWTPEAFAEASRRNVPVHLSVGYAACHWCHVMAHESFSDPDTAALLNERFVNIKVDREERPDVDQIYMRALSGLGQHGGWPLTMFLTPDGEPFWGGTYFPPEPRWGRPSFRQMLEGVWRAWQGDQDAVAQNSRALKELLNRQPAAGGAALDPDLPAQAAGRILTLWDNLRGGFSGAPKFPQAPVLDLLWRMRLRTGDESYEQAVLTTLTGLCQGGIYDHLGGGFSRYSVDADWLVPHFEKMLSDNGQILALLVQAHGRTGSPLFRQRIEETAGWLLREMRLEGGAFASSLDADTEGEEGATYVWTLDEINQALGGDAARFADIYGVKQQGNFEGKSNLNRLAPASREWLGDAEEARLASMRARLLAIRDRRPQPGRDDKVLADWNGAAIAGLAQAGLALGRPDWLDAAAAAFRFIAETMTRDGGRLGHATARGQLVFPGFATDYAQMIRAALTLYSATAEEAYLDRARRWYEALEADYFDEPSGRYYLTAHSGEALVARPGASSDDPMPSANGVMVQNCVQLFNLTAEERYRSRAEAILQAHAAEMAADVVGSAGLLAGLDSVLRGRLALLTGGGDLEPLRALVRHEADPALLVMEAANGKGEPPRPEMQAMAGDATALLLCDASACRAPVSDARHAEALLAETRAGLAA